MSADKRKKFMRACERLRQINTSYYSAPSLSGPKKWRRNRWSTKDPVLRYIVKKGLANIVRVNRVRTYAGAMKRNTIIDTGFERAPLHGSPKYWF